MDTSLMEVSFHRGYAIKTFALKIYYSINSSSFPGTYVNGTRKVKHSRFSEAETMERSVISLAGPYANNLHLVTDITIPVLHCSVIWA